MWRVHESEGKLENLITQFSVLGYYYLCLHFAIGAGNTWSSGVHLNIALSNKEKLNNTLSIFPLEIIKTIMFPDEWFTVYCMLINE